MGWMTVTSDEQGTRRWTDANAAEDDGVPGMGRNSAVKMSRLASLPLQHTNYPWTLREHTNYPWTLTEHTNYPWTLTEEQATVPMNTDITHKSTYGHWQNTQKYLWTLTEHIKIPMNTDRTYKSTSGHTKHINIPMNTHKTHRSTYEHWWNTQKYLWTLTQVHTAVPMDTDSSTHCSTHGHCHKYTLSIPKSRSTKRYRSAIYQWLSLHRHSGKVMMTHPCGKINETYNYSIALYRKWVIHSCQPFHALTFQKKTV